MTMSAGMSKIPSRIGYAMLIESAVAASGVVKSDTEINCRI